MTEELDPAFEARCVAAEEALTLSTTLATLATIRGQMASRADVLHRIVLREPTRAERMALQSQDLLLAPVHPSERQVRELAGSRTLRAIATVRQRSLADFLG